MSSYLAYLRRGLELAGDPHALADAVGVNYFRILKTLKHAREGTGGRGDSYALGAIACAKLAILIDEPVGQVLRAANKADLAEAVDAAYGQVVRLRADDRELMRVWREELSAEDRRHLRAIIKQMAAARRG